MTWKRASACPVLSCRPLSPDVLLADVPRLLSELKLVGYALDAFSAPHVASLVQRLEGHVTVARSTPGQDFFDPAVLGDMFFPLEGAWMEHPGVQDGMLLAP